MPPGSVLAQSLRNAHERTIGSRKSRHSLQPNSFLSPSAAHRAHLPKKRKIEQRQTRRPSLNESGENGSENQKIPNLISRFPTRVSRGRKSRGGLHPSAELYSKKLYRNVATGYDMDADSEPETEEYAQQVVITDSWKPEYSGGNQELAHPELIPQMVVEDDDTLLRVKGDFFMPVKRVMTDTTAAYYDDRIHCPGMETDQICYQVTAQDRIFVEKLNAARPLQSRKRYLNIATFAEIMKTLEVQSYRTIHNHLLDYLHRVYTNTEGSGEAEELAECDVCRFVDVSEGEEMVFCDMCHTCVHTACAGIDVVPSGPWKCAKCAYANTPCPPCCLCPTLGGSMTYNPDKTLWAHHVCALFLPEILFGDIESRCPFMAFEQIPIERFEQICAVCDTNKGACLPCSYPECEEVQHVACALRVGLTVGIQETETDVTRVMYCHKHTFEKAEENERKFAGRMRKESEKPPKLYIENRFRSFRNPWLAKLESIFFLMTDYEQVGRTVPVEEIVISDVYEYWKQKRLDRKNQPLIENLRDYVEIEPTIDRVALRAVEELEEKQDHPTEPITSLPDTFFRRAALMVTEVRQPSLKRVRETIQMDRQLLTLVEQREMMKRDSIRADLEMFDAATRLARKKGPTVVMEAWKVSEEEMRNARDPAVFAKAMAELGEVTSPSTSQNRRASHLTSSPSKRKTFSSIQLTISPLRPRNLSTQVEQISPSNWGRIEAPEESTSSGTSGKLETAAERRVKRGLDPVRRTRPICIFRRSRHRQTSSDQPSTSQNSDERATRHQSSVASSPPSSTYFLADEEREELFVDCNDQPFKRS